jgi:hypothetical protein
MMMLRGKINPRFAFYLLALSLIGGVAILGRGARVRARDRASAVNQPRTVQATGGQHRIFAPHWTTEDGFSTTIYIRNVHVSEPLVAKPSLIFADRTVALPAIAVDPLQTVGIDVGQSLLDHHQVPELSGAAVIDFEAESAGAVNAYAQVLNTGKSLAFTFPFMQDGAPAGGPLDAVAWYYSSATDGFLALQNTTENETTAVPTVFFSGKESRLDPVKLGPLHAATVKLPPLDAGSSKAKARTVGVRVEYDGGPGSVVAQGWVADEAIGFSNPFGFHPKSNCNCGDQLQHRYGTGIMIGSPAPNMGFPGGTVFSPYLAMRNRSDKPLIVRPVFSYDRGRGHKTVKLPRVALDPEGTATMNLRDFQESGIIPLDVDAGSIDLQFKGESGALVSELASVDQSGSFVSRVPMICAGVRDSHMSFWRTDGDWQSQLTIQNLARSQNDVEVTISYPGGVYVVQSSIAAGDTAMVSINALQQQQQPDAAGRRIPMGATVGGVNIWSRSARDGLVVNAMLMNPATKTCGQCTEPGYVTQYTISDQAAYTGSPLYSGFAPHGANLKLRDIHKRAVFLRLAERRHPSVIEQRQHQCGDRNGGECQSRLARNGRHYGQF